MLPRARTRDRTIELPRRAAVASRAPGEALTRWRVTGVDSLDRLARGQYALAGAALEFALVQTRLARACAPWASLAAGIEFGRAIGAHWLARVSLDAACVDAPAPPAPRPATPAEAARGAGSGARAVTAAPRSPVRALPARRTSTRTGAGKRTRR